MTVKVDSTISLQIIEEEHAASIFDLVNADRPHLRKWLPWVDNMITVADFRDYIVDSKNLLEKGTDYGFVITYNGTVAGRIGIHHIQAQNKIGAIGYWLGSSFQGRGIILKAAKAIISYGFTFLNLNRIEIKCGTENFRSQSVAAKLNFKKEGIIRQGEFLYDAFIDLYLYSMLKEEWKAQA